MHMGVEIPWALGEPLEGALDQTDVREMRYLIFHKNHVLKSPVLQCRGQASSSCFTFLEENL